MKRLLVTLSLLLSVCHVVAVQAQQKTEAESKLVEFHMALMKKGPKWSSEQTPEMQKLRQEHLAYFEELFKTGKVVLGGPFEDDGEVRGIGVFRAGNADEAKTLAEGDPRVKAGFFVIEMHPWWSEEVMKKASLPLKWSKAYLGFLTRGARWTAEKTPETAELQKAHLANIYKLAEMKKLVVAGPFGDNGQLRGIFVFKVASLEEAKVLSATDPSVQAGRLAIEVRPWLVPEGVLP
jgi:uncharacterized protein YciI